LYVEQEKDSVNHPKFRNWLYIYKNFSVEPDYKAVLQQNYLTDVQDVDRLDRNEVRQEAESIQAPESAQDAVGTPVQDENINGMKPDRQESDDSMTREKLEDPILPETGKETIVPSESKEGDKMPQKVENPMTSSKSEEIMQVSEDDAVTKPNKGGPLKIVFSIPFPEKLKVRKMYGEREASPFGSARTMQEEMMGKAEEKADDKKKDEKIEGMKEKESMNEDKEIPSDDKKEEKIYEIKDEIKNDKIKEDEKMDVNKEEKKGDKLENIKNDQTEAMEDDKMVTMKDDKMEAMKDDKMEPMKDDKMEAMKDDKMEAMKDDKMEAMKGEMLIDENKGNDNKDAMSEGVKNEMIKDDSKKEEVMTDDKDKKREAMIAGDRMVAPIKEEKEAMLAVDRNVRHLDLSRLSRGSLQLDDITSSIASTNVVTKDAKSECILKKYNGISKPVFMSFERKL
jgi:hypothetical protein